MSKWNCIPLAELLAPGRRISYGIVQPGSHQNDGVPIVRVSDIRNGRIDTTKPLRVSSEVEASYARTRLHGGELLLTLVGTVGETAVVPPELQGWNVARAVAVIPVRSDVGAYWVKLALGAPNVQEVIHGRLNTTVQATLNLKDVAQLPVLLPDPAERTSISRIVGTLDHKIALNQRMNETLEAMARAIFQSWFVDFDPMRAKASELIAERVLTIGDGYRAKNDELGTEGLPFIRAAELNNGFDTLRAERLRPDRLPAARGKQAQIGDVAFTSKGTVGRFARVGEFTEPFIYSPQICFWRSLRPEIIHPAVLYCWMQSGEFVSQIDSVAGQTDMAPYVSLRDQKGMSVPRFHESQMQLGERISPLLRMMSEKQAECRTLAALRDALIPELLSGATSPALASGTEAELA